MSRVRSIVVSASALLVASAGVAMARPIDVCNPALPYTLPDHDQVRQAGVGIFGLQNNGTQYCVPTCTTNILTYLQNHGYPNLDIGAGPGPWLGNNNLYNQFGMGIDALGVMMNTNPDGGTGGTNALAGVRQWIENAGYEDDIVVSAMGMTIANAPELGDIALALNARCPISLSVGWYSTLPNGFVVRNGGHCVSAIRLPNFCGPNRQLSIRDPGNSIGSDAFSQAVGTTETYSIQTQNILRVDADDNNQVVFSGPAERIVGYGTRGIIDGFRAYTPVWGLSACNNPVNGSCVQQFIPKPTFTTLPNTTHSQGNTQSYLSITLEDTLVSSYALGHSAGNPGDIHIESWALGATNPERVDFPGLAAFSPVDIACGANRTLFARTSNPNVVLKINMRSKLIEPSTVADPASALAIDTRNNEVVVFSSAARRMTRFNPDTMAPIGSRNLPSSVPVGPSPKIAVNPKTGDIWLVSGLNTGYALGFGSGPDLSVVGTINHTAPLEGVDTTPSGNVVTTSGGQPLEFSHGTTVLAWARVSGSQFDGLINGPIFAIAKNRSNLNRALHDSPEETTSVLPTSFAASVRDCRADFDRDGVLTVNDVFSFLNAWFAGDFAADFNENNNLDVSDIFDMLNAWFAGCPS